MKKSSPVIAFILLTFFAKGQTSIPVPYDCFPQFPGGDTALIGFIARHTTYPDSARVHDIQGKVLFTFDIDTDGLVKNIVLRRGIDKYLNAEALRVMHLLPRFIPCKQKRSMALPFNFKL